MLYKYAASIQYSRDVLKEQQQTPTSIHTVQVQFHHFGLSHCMNCKLQKKGGGGGGMQ